MSRYVLDASVIVAAALVEEGAEQAARLIAHGIISTVNLSEAIQRIAEVSQSMEKALWAVSSLQIERVPFDEEQALIAATMRTTTRHKGISFGDRACLSLALARKLPALTGDSGWAGLDVGVAIEWFR